MWLRETYNRNINLFVLQTLAMTTQQTLAVCVRQQPIHGLRQRRKGSFRTDDMNDTKVYNRLRQRALRAK